MQIVDIRPRTPAWHTWRAKGIGASESAIILSRSPYKTPWQLWAEKSGLQLPPSLEHNPHVQRGIRLEPRARAMIETRYQELLLPLCAVSTAYPFLQASFDGINSLGEPVEIKCPSDTVFEQAKAEGMNADVVKLYSIQVQHQLLVANQSRGWLMFYRESEGAEPELLPFEILADSALQTQIVESANAFYQSVLTGKAPAKCLERDNFIPEGQDAVQWLQLAKIYNALDSQANTLMQSLESVKHEMKTVQQAFVQLMAGFAQADFAGIKVSRFWSQGAVDYSKLLVDLGHHLPESALAPYRKSPTERLRVTVTQPPPSDVEQSIITLPVVESAPHLSVPIVITPQHPVIPSDIVLDSLSTIPNRTQSERVLVGYF